MKKIAGILALVALFQIEGFGGTDPEQKTNVISPVFKVLVFQKPIPDNAPGLRQKKIGTTLTVIGSVLLVTGTAMASSADSYSYNYSNTNGTLQESGDIKGALGVTFMAGGIGMIIPGVIMWTKGSRKLKAYKETITFNLNGTSAALAYRF